jgi:hypothetical protein
MNRLARMHWASTFTNMTVDEQLILLQGVEEAFTDMSELVDELMFDREISDKKKLKEIQAHIRQELREMKP